MPKPFFQYWLPVILYAIFIFSLSSIGGCDLPQELPISDSLLHILEYLPFGFLIYRAIKNTRTNFSIRKIILFSFLIAFAYSLSDEFHQLFVSGRQASLLDLISDTIGAIIGIRIAI